MYEAMLRILAHTLHLTVQDVRSCACETISTPLSSW